MTFLLLACVENALVGPKSGSPFDTGDTAPEVETAADTESPPDTGPPPVECPDEPPADGVVTADADCSGDVTPFTGDFVELWRVVPPEPAVGLHAARIHDENGDGAVDQRDPMQVIVDEGWGAVGVYSSAGARLVGYEPGSWRVTGTTGDVDPGNAGSEVVVSGYYRGAEDYLVVADEGAELWSNVVAEGGSMYPWLTDLEGDGALEVFAWAYVLDLGTGGTEAKLEGAWMGDEMPGVTSDLDGDGVEEILFGGVYPGTAQLFAADGSARATCYRSGATSYAVGFAVGDLDGDADGEWVAAGSGFLATCDADGSLIGLATPDFAEPGLVGLGQLDADPAPEILVGDALGLFAFDTDLTPLWSYSLSKRWEWYPFSLADLDGDGLHEVLVHHDVSLVVLDAAGGVLATWPVDTTSGSSWKSQPIVVDVDADGLAEILVGTYGVVALESPEGGWSVRDAEYEWPGPDRHPGDREIDGTVARPNPFWLDPERNVWQGLPAGPGARPELTVAIETVCVEACDAEAVVTVRVDNVGADALVYGTSVRLATIDTGEVLGEASIGESLESGVARHLTFRVPADRLAFGLRATVDPDARVPECDERANEDEWRDSPCP